MTHEWGDVLFPNNNTNDVTICINSWPWLAVPLCYLLVLGAASVVFTFVYLILSRGLRIGESRHGCSMHWLIASIFIWICANIAALVTLLFGSFWCVWRDPAWGQLISDWDTSVIIFLWYFSHPQKGQSVSGHDTLYSACVCTYFVLLISLWESVCDSVMMEPFGCNITMSWEME
jgi:hypothetical protein